jgi:hypothetical protein
MQLIQRQPRTPRPTSIDKRTWCVVDGNCKHQVEHPSELQPSLEKHMDRSSIRKQQMMKEC